MRRTVRVYDRRDGTLLHEESMSWALAQLEALTPFNVGLLVALAFVVWLTLDLRALFVLASCIGGPVLLAIGVAEIL